MRTIVIACAILALSACNQSESSDNSVQAGRDLTADSIGSNDTTAIDAATNDAANMAADVEYSINELDNEALEANELTNIGNN